MVLMVIGSPFAAGSFLGVRSGDLCLTAEPFNVVAFCSGCHRWGVGACSGRSWLGLLCTWEVRSIFKGELLLSLLRPTGPTVATRVPVFHSWCFVRVGTLWVMIDVWVGWGPSIIPLWWRLPWGMVDLIRLLGRLSRRLLASGVVSPVFPMIIGVLHTVLQVGGAGHCRRAFMLDQIPTFVKK